jgi:protein TonB
MSFAYAPAVFDDAPVREERRAHERLLAAALAASAVLHLVAIGLAPRASSVEPPPPPALNVVIVPKPVPPPPAPVTPPVPRPMKSEPRRVTKPQPVAKPQPQPPREATPTPAPDRKPVLALPETAPSAPTFSVPQAPPQPPAPEPKPSAAAAPPGPAPAAKEPVATSQPVFDAGYLRNARPRYPLIARRNGVEGTVRLNVLVTKDGRPAQIQLRQSSGSSVLDSAALDAVKQWQFAPARRGQEPVEQWVEVPIVFRLDGAS